MCSHVARGTTVFPMAYVIDALHRSGTFGVFFAVRICLDESSGCENIINVAKIRWAL